MTLKNKVMFITGASRGIGLAIALKAAKDGARIVIAAKTAATNDKLPGTIYSAAAEIKAAGGEALAIQCDVRDEEQIKAAIAKAVETFGGIDIVVNNAGAIQLTNTEQTEMKRFDLMQSVNARAVFMVVKHALPYLKKSTNAHVLNLSPPLNLDADWLAPHLAYTLSKYGMSLCTLGQAAELKKFGIAVNSLWPETAIDTSAIRNLLGGDQSVQASRKPEIVADAAYWIFNQPAATCSGNFFIDSAVLTAAGETDLSKYAVDPTATLLPDFFLGKPPKVLPKVKATEPAAAKADGAPVVATDASTVALKAEPVAPKYKSFSVTVADHVATLVFTNAKRSNAMGEAFWTEFPQAIKELAAQGDTRALVIYGEGDHFSAGIDLAMFQSPTLAPALANLQSAEGKDHLLQVITRMQDAFTAIEKAPFPVIAAIHGVCLGAGLDLAAACDFRYACSSASFAIEEINLGIMADLGSLQRLPLIMPAGLVREMAFTGMRIASDRALSSGLVNAVYPLKDDLIKFVMQTAQVMASKSTKAASATKQSLNYGIDHGVFESLHLTAKLQTRVIDPAEIVANIKKLKKG
ncbi:MAG: family oxidoreductase [Cyanobacteriota bacterium erpe_2018_sw_21hr_WHONDRS-SW48-000092_B_bin.40]|nr:family oxidoreductase [Cyanobacteriota bacterium erpe_2018_sw_21hr_WHONDRS-SW48-000092_B_bin.40]